MRDSLPENPVPNYPPPPEVARQMSAEDLVREALARWGRVWSPNKLDEAVAAVYDWLSAGDWRTVKFTDELIDEASADGTIADEWIKDS